MQQPKVIAHKSLSIPPKMTHLFARRLWLAIFIVLAVLLSGSALWFHARRAAVASPVYRLVAGQKLVYALGYDNTVNADLTALLPGADGGGAAASGMTQKVKTQISGKWIAVVVKSTADERVMACHLEDASVDIQAGASDVSQQAAQVKSDLARPFWVRQSARGRIEDVRFDEQTPASSQAFARALLSWWQFVTPGPNPNSEQKNDQTWESTESDTAGRYIARYAPAPDAAPAKTADDATADDTTRAQSGIADESGALFRKTKVRYLPPPAPQNTTTEAASANEVKSDANLLARFGDGVLQALSGSENQTLSMTGQGVATSQTNVALRLMKSEPVADAALQSLRDANAQNEKTSKAVELFAVPDADEMRQTTRKNTLAEETVGSLLEQLAQAQKSGATNDSQLYAKLRALAEVEPKSCESLGAVLMIAPAQNLTFHILSQALSAARGDAAQQALLQVTRARIQDEGAAAQLIPLLGMTATPSPDTQKLLAEIARSSDVALSSTAQLALGNIARSLATSDSARSSQIVDELVSQLARARDDIARQQILLTLGNTGSKRALDALQLYAKNKNVALRATALNSLRFVDDVRVEGLLTSALAGDSQPEARIQAALALNFRPMTPQSYAAQKTALLKDADKKVRLTVLSNLARADFRQNATQTLIAQLAKSDPSPDVRRAAAQLIAPGASAATPN